MTSIFSLDLMSYQKEKFEIFYFYSEKAILSNGLVQAQLEMNK